MPRTNRSNRQNRNEERQNATWTNGGQHVPQRGSSRISKATRDEAEFNRINQTSYKHDMRANGYSREEAAFNKGRDANADRLNAARLKNQRDFQQATTLAQRKAASVVGNAVPSQNPTASGSGRTWKNHKYTAKVIGKNGKVRYIYGDPSAKAIGDKELKRAEDELKKANTALYRPTTKQTIAISARKSGIRNTGSANRPRDPISELKRNADAVVRKASKAASDGANYVKNKLSDAIASTPIKDLF